MTSQDESDVIIWRRYSDGYVVRSMRPSEANILQNFNRGGLRISKYDLSLAMECFDLRKPGFYVGELDGKVIASLIRIPWGDNIIYGSYYYVLPEYRKKGYGTRLREEVAKVHVGSQIVCIDSGRVAVEYNEQKFGYVKAYETHRLQRKDTEPVASLANKPEGVTLAEATEIDFDQLVAFDNQHFVSRNNPARRKLLAKWIKIKGGASYVAIDAENNLVGYGCRRPSLNQPKCNQLGPVYANSAGVAELITVELCKEIVGQDIIADISEPNTAAKDLFSRLGFQLFDAGIRMHLNGDPKEFKDSVYCLTSLDICGF